ncbi:hypothetical protein SOVF_055330 [Spinacia oleracea]|nr:hypothetical protein SOVF_055330 [Spinacia oleracea]
MQAEVPDTRHIFVDVGLGFHVEFTWSEALSYIAAKGGTASQANSGIYSSGSINQSTN